MATTQFTDLKSEDILSAHISGLQHSINKLENALNMKTVEKTNHELIPVTDQVDPTLHHIIYEGTSRNWLINPAPVIKRNGVVVPEAEYDIQPAYGVVVFKNQQGAEYNITADFTQIISESQTIDDLNNNIANVSNGIDSKLSANHTFAVINTPNTYITNSPMANPELDTTSPSTDAGGKNLDLFPFIVTKPTKFDRMGIPFNQSGPTGGTFTKLGLYSSNENDVPTTLVAQTEDIAHPANNAVGSYTFISGSFPVVTIQPGVYWLARWNNGESTGNTYYYGTKISQCYGLGSAFGTIPNSSQFGGVKSHGFYGYRATVDYTTGLPNTLPTIGPASFNLRFLERAVIANPWIRRTT